eukprot:gnl/MRDRNA2_/MRDRNA2_60711_c0_seq1.p1 gnl/MRDRNA2_/MRDRNA2_60711_c0~~gnl/MRDRNA2_/MRDRNA2_60711_c0_seq1.p1  ORF type:complete len:113 (-),score=2.12 gnl/MRDRNA2_/MRDRNA2_60711_c0_seq1:234-572(-)
MQTMVRRTAGLSQMPKLSWQGPVHSNRTRSALSPSPTLRTTCSGISLDHFVPLRMRRSQAVEPPSQLSHKLAVYVVPGASRLMHVSATNIAVNCSTLLVNQATSTMLTDGCG